MVVRCLPLGAPEAGGLIVHSQGTYWSQVPGKMVGPGSDQIGFTTREMVGILEASTAKFFAH